MSLRKIHPDMVDSTWREHVDGEISRKIQGISLDREEISREIDEKVEFLHSETEIIHQRIAELRTLIEEEESSAPEMPSYLASMITTDENHRFVTDVDKYNWNNKAENSVATTTSNGLMTKEDKVKLSGIATGANNYIHPSTHPASIITQTAEYRFVTDSEKNNWNSKADSMVASTSNHGLMSSADKSKLDGIATGATKTVITNSLTSTSTSNALSAYQGKVLNDKVEELTAKSSKLDNIYQNNVITTANGTAFGTRTVGDGLGAFAQGYQSRALGHQSYATGWGSLAGYGDVYVIESINYTNKTIQFKAPYPFGINAPLTSSMYIIGSPNVNNGDIAEITFSNYNGDNGVLTYTGDLVESSSTKHSYLLNITNKNSTSSAHGAGTISSGYASFSQGRSTVASGNASHAEGFNSIANGNHSHAEGQNTIASGIASHAQNSSTTASGDFSHSEGAGTKATAIYSHAEGFTSTASGEASHAEGYSTTASGKYSHAEGYNTIANGENSHAEGSNTVASGVYSHAEGAGTTASGEQAHAEGNSTIASGTYSHAQGSNTKASGSYSHAEGSNTVASGGYGAHAGGYYTTASGDQSLSHGEQTDAKNYNSVAIGYYSNMTFVNKSSHNTSMDAFVIGGGTSSTPSNAFRVTYDGRTFGKSAFNSTGADYAEYFEWEDGNKDNEDRVGYFVTIDGEKIRKSNSNDDYILGIVSVNPSVVGDSWQDEWNEKYVRDEWGRVQCHYVDSLPKYIDIPTGEFDENGKEIHESINVNEGKQDYVQILNPDWNPEEKYIPREERKEWSPIGMMGKLLVRDDGTCQVNGYCKSNDDGVATASDTNSGFRVMKKVSENTILVLIK